MTLLIQNISYLVTDANTVLKNVDMLVEGDQIAAIGSGLAVPAGAKVISGEGQAIMPGFVNAHTHLWQMTIKGRRDDLPLATWCDEVLTPMQCEFLSLDGLSKILYVVEQSRESGANPHLKHEGVLMTMYSNTNLANQVIAQVKEVLPNKMYNTVIPRSVRVAEAPSFGKTVIEHDPYGQASLAYQNAAKEFLSRHR